jgi:hypothetical protein
VPSAGGDSLCVEEEWDEEMVGCRLVCSMPEKSACLHSELANERTCCGNNRRRQETSHQWLEEAAQYNDTVSRVSQLRGSDNAK